MIDTQPERPAGSRFAAACLASLMVALAACSSTNSTSPSGSAPSNEAVSTASAAPTAVPVPTSTPSARVVATPSPSPDITLPPAARGQQTIHLILHPGNDTGVSVGSLTGCSGAYCPGDYRLGNDPVFDVVSGKQVGTLFYVEFVVLHGESLFHSPGNTFDLAGRGQIVFSETLYDDGSGRPATGAILGGTGEFLGATGYVVSRSLPGVGDFVITITK